MEVISHCRWLLPALATWRCLVLSIGATGQVSERSSLAATLSIPLAPVDFPLSRDTDQSAFSVNNGMLSFVRPYTR